MHILLATYNGAKYLRDQLDSIAKQTYNKWTLIVSDDGSTDETVNIVNIFAHNSQQSVKLMCGPCTGSLTDNFWHLIKHSPLQNSQDLYAFCDQDDVWFENKLERAVNWHLQHLEDPLRLFCGRTKLVNDQLIPIGLSPSLSRPPSFGNALVQNISSGNTMIFSSNVLIAQKEILPEHIVWHDWTTYLVVTAMGGIVHFENDPCLMYRQHEKNAIGANDNLRKHLDSIKLSLGGRYKHRINKNLLALNDLKILDVSNVKEQYDLINCIREVRSPIKKVSLLMRSKLRRQGWLSNVGLLILSIFGRF